MAHLPSHCEHLAVSANTCPLSLPATCKKKTFKRQENISLHNSSMNLLIIADINLLPIQINDLYIIRKPGRKAPPGRYTHTHTHTHRMEDKITVGHGREAFKWILQKQGMGIIWYRTEPSGWCVGIVVIGSVH
jgi:hypothetical protein